MRSKKILIDTTEKKNLILAFLLDKKIIVKQTKLVTGLSESLLPELSKFLKKHKIRLKDISKIFVNPGPGGFSATRTGVAVANALAYALGMPVAEWPSGKIKKLVLPKYDREPNITKPKRA